MRLGNTRLRNVKPAAKMAERFFYFFLPFFPSLGAVLGSNLVVANLHFFVGETH